MCRREIENKGDPKAAWSYPQKLYLTTTCWKRGELKSPANSLSDDE